MNDSQHYCLRWTNHHGNLLTVFQELLHNPSFTDVTLVADCGQKIECHKLVLAACSTYFQNLFHDVPCPHPIIILKDVKSSEIRAILEYMYRGEVNVAQEQLHGLLKVAQILKVKGLTENSSQSDTPHDLRREDTIDTSVSPPPAISTSTGSGGGGGNHSSPPHSALRGGYSPFYGLSSRASFDDRRHHLMGSITWPLPLHAGRAHQIPTSLTSSVLGGGGGEVSGGSHDNGIENSVLLKRKQLMAKSTWNTSDDTPILRTVLRQAHVDSSQPMPLLQPDSHEPVHRNANSNGSASNDNRRSSDLVPSEAVHDVPCDDDDRQTSPQSYGGDTVRNTVVADQPKPEWKRYKQYTRDDITGAIEAVRKGMSAVAAARSFGVPSRTLYDKVKKLGIPTSRPFKRSLSNNGGACFPFGIGANANGTLYDASNSNAASETENENAGGNIKVEASTSAAAFEAAYAKEPKDTQDCDAMSDSQCNVHCKKQQQDMDDQVEDLSVSRKSDVPVIVSASTTSVAIKSEVQETELDNKDCCDYS